MILHKRNICCKVTENELKILSQQDRIIKICADAGFLTTVAVGQYFMTKDTEEFSQFTDSVVCREYFAKRRNFYLNLNVGSEGTPKLVPCWKLQPVAYRVNMEWKSELSLWTKTILTRGKEFLLAWISWSRTKTKTTNNEQETSEKQTEEHALQLNISALASRSKAKAKPQRRDLASSSTGTIPIEKRTWTDIEPGEFSLSDYPVSKKLINLLRHGSLLRETDGAIEFWRRKDYLQKYFMYCHRWSDEKWKSSMAGGGGKQEKISILYWLVKTRNSLPPSSSRSFRMQSYSSFIAGQCWDSGRFFFKYIYHVGCVIHLHSIINPGLIPGGQNLSNRQTVFFLLVDPMDKEHKVPDTLDLEAPRLAQSMLKAWKKHQNRVYWVDIKLAQKKGFEFYQTRSNATIFCNTLPAYCIPKAIKIETGEIIYENVYASPRPPPKISLKYDWMKELGSEGALQAEVSLPIQPNPNHYRTGRPVVCSTRAPRSSDQEIKTRSHSDCKNFNVEGDANHWRTERPVVCSAQAHHSSEHNTSQTRSSRDCKSIDLETLFAHKLSALFLMRWTLTSEYLDFHIQLWNKFKALVFVNSLRRSGTTPFSQISKKMIQDMGNVELLELCETNPKTQCTECLVYWWWRHCLLHLRASK